VSRFSFSKGLQLSRQTMPIDQSIDAQVNMCVLLAPVDVKVGKHVTDAVRAGGWSLLRTAKAIDAMAALCTLEQARRTGEGTPDARHMLLVDGAIERDEITALMNAVRKHLPSVKVHEMTSPASAGAGAEGAADSPVLGRIGRGAQDTSATNPVKLHAEGGETQEIEDGETESMPPPHEVTRDEISMLLSDDANSTPASSGRKPRLPGEGR
jgi:hypothetical protein